MLTKKTPPSSDLWAGILIVTRPALQRDSIANFEQLLWLRASTSDLTPPPFPKLHLRCKTVWATATASFLLLRPSDGPSAGSPTAGSFPRDDCRFKAHNFKCGLIHHSRIRDHVATPSFPPRHLDIPRSLTVLSTRSSNVVIPQSEPSPRCA